jgi:N-acetylmuramoyl-L-alanine amidase
MKQIIILFFILVYLPVFAQDFTGIKICLNPGHGGHDSDDRNMVQTGFWESESNLTKGLFLRDILQNWGAKVVMSRVENRTQDDLPLTQISQIANDNKVDMFHAIHSNADNQRNNFALMLFKGYTAKPAFPDSKRMGSIMWKNLIRDHRQIWTQTWENNQGDWDFYYDVWGTSGLGVLRNLAMPGVLSEGSHHDYLIECWRLQNLDYRKHESWIFAHSFIEYFEKEPFKRGEIIGIIRDSTIKTIYNFVPTSKDEFKPLNKIKITLQPGNKVYNGDEMNNGFFMFDSLVPGTYKLYYEVEKYLKDSATVKVAANQTSFADKFMKYDTTRVPEVLSYTPANPNDSVSAGLVIKINFSEKMLLSSFQKAIVFNPSVEFTYLLENDDKTLVITPKKPLEKATSYQLTINKFATQIWKVPLAKEKNISFITKNRNRLALVDSYPKNGLANVTTKLQVKLCFDAELSQVTLIGTVILTDLQNVEIPITNKKIFTINNRGYFTFEPEKDLEQGKEYKVKMTGEVRDFDNNPLYDSKEITFKTTAPFL